MLYIRIFKGSNLGNWMFQYAHGQTLIPGGAMTWACDDEETRCKVERYRVLFPGAQVMVGLPDGIQMVYEWQEQKFASKGFPTRGDWILDGYFQDFRFLDLKLTRMLFVCPEEIRKDLFARYPHLSSGRTLVGVSVRRGDYLKIPHLLPFVGKDYLTKAISLFDRKSLFVVCSDDIPWCERFFASKRFRGREFLFVRADSVLSQLFIHTFCSHNIISNSTFSWWGAFLNSSNGKRTVFPSMWFGMSERYRRPNLYWEGVEIAVNSYTVSRYVHALLLSSFRRLKIMIKAVLRR